VSEQAEAELPADISDLIGVTQYPRTATFPVELAYAYNTLAATENANPLYWDSSVAAEITGGMTMPPSTLSLWMRPHRWTPGASEEQVALQVHFDLKKRLGLAEAIMSDNSLVLHEPVRPGDVISHHQVLRSVSGLKTTKLGEGRFWVVDVEYHNQQGDLVGLESYTGFGYVSRARSAEAGPAEPSAAEPAAGGLDSEARCSGGQAEEQADGPADDGGRTARDGAGLSGSAAAGRPAANASHGSDDGIAGPGNAALADLHYDVTATTVVLGALASRDWRPMHHDYRFATERNGTRDIFMNAPNLAAWFERYITDWSGPSGRIGRMTFRIRDSIFPGDRMTISGRVSATSRDRTGCSWSELDIRIKVADRLCCTCAARVALPDDPSDNPWTRRGESWRP